MSYSKEDSSLNSENHLGNLQDGCHSESSSVNVRVTRPRSGSSPYGAVFIVINAALGAGLLTFPYTFYLTGGWYWGLILQLVSSVTLLACVCADCVKLLFHPVFSSSGNGGDNDLGFLC